MNMKYAYILDFVYLLVKTLMNNFFFAIKNMKHKKQAILNLKKNIQKESFSNA